jgi:hypothetical protein
MSCNSEFLIIQHTENNSPKTRSLTNHHFQYVCLFHDPFISGYLAVMSLAQTFQAVFVSWDWVQLYIMALKDQYKSNMALQARGDMEL